MDGDNKMEVVFKPENNTVRMDRNELCELFGCYIRDIDKCLENIFQREMFRVEDTCRYHLIAGGKRIGYDITEVNLSVIIALAFMITTPQAGTLRTWFITQFTRMKSLDITVPDIGEAFRLN
jgi:hypothetical protein